MQKLHLMKSFLFFVTFISISIIVVAQQSYQDVVYLKNGSIIRGVIIEQIPNKSIKIETADKSVFVYQLDEIEKMAKEAKPYSPHSLCKKIVISQNMNTLTT